MLLVGVNYDKEKKKKKCEKRLKNEICCDTLFTIWGKISNPVTASNRKGRQVKA